MMAGCAEQTPACVVCSGAAQLSLDSPAIRNEPEFQMTITTANIPAIVALIAGILILVMPRILNFVVAIYLIFIGLVGLGLFKMLKF